MKDMNSDMEDMLRRAASDYPLKQPTDRWSDVEAKINFTAASNTTRHSRKLQALLILLIFLVLTTCGFLIFDSYNTHGKQQPEMNVVTNSFKQPAKNTLHLDEKSGITNRPGPQSQAYVPMQEASKSAKQVWIPIKQSTQAGTFAFIHTQKNLLDTYVEKNYHTQLAFTKRAALLHSTNDGANENILGLQESIFRLNLEPLDNSAFTKNKKRNNFYYGVTGGLQLNTIKDQASAKTGYQLGIVGGYQISKSLSVESGFIFSEKYYYSPARYFDMKEMKQTMPAGMEMIEINGSSKIIEIPVHVYFKKELGNGNRLIAGAGISSYIMAEENNQYSIRLNGTDSKMNGVYKKDRKYAAATIDFGIGYEKNINQYNYIRLAPQVQLPLKGIGLGDLPVMSLGARLTYIHHLR